MNERGIGKMKVLVVEDEKMIRQGIKTMIQRSSVPIDTIYECKNGEEALELLHQEKVDILFTDIRMPKMDGIELIQHVYNMPYKPEIVVLSGYDDFNYAVEVLRWGAKEYILKPINRNKIEEVLKKLEKVIADKIQAEKKEGAIKKILEQQLKYIILNEHITLEEIETNMELIENNFLKEIGYTVYCWYSKEAISQAITQENTIYLQDINGYDLLITCENSKEPLLINQYENICIGISQVHESIKELREAYLEAYESRQYAYLSNTPTVSYSQIGGKLKKATLSYNEIHKMIKRLGTIKIEEVEKQYLQVFAPEELSQIQYTVFEETIKNIIEQIKVSYAAVLEAKQIDLDILLECFKYHSVEEYKLLLLTYLKNIHEYVMEEHEDFRNKQKMKEALKYIDEYYNTDLNMAVVSNHISMNYSFFSQIFKQYTGMNFVNYIKEVRVNKAKELLIQTDEKVAQIGYTVGYDNEKYFMTVFKNIVGISPTEYRRNALLGR